MNADVHGKFDSAGRIFRAESEKGPVEARHGHVRVGAVEVLVETLVTAVIGAQRITAAAACTGVLFPHRGLLRLRTVAVGVVGVLIRRGKNCVGAQKKTEKWEKVGAQENAEKWDG